MWQVVIGKLKKKKVIFWGRCKLELVTAYYLGFVVKLLWT